jgi:hypothetical protein
MRASCTDCGRAPASGARARPRADARPGRLGPRKPKVVPDAAHPGMWRVRWPDGRLSDTRGWRKRDDQNVCRKAECRNNSASRDESISHARSGHSVRTEAALWGAPTCFQNCFSR